MSIGYAIFGLAVLGRSAYAEYRGLSFMRYARATSPNSIRDNPRTYRAATER